MWKAHFKVVGIVPGEVIIPGYGKIDFKSESLSEDMCLELVENDFPYLAMTNDGKDFFYGPVIKTKQMVRKSLPKR